MFSRESNFYTGITVEQELKREIKNGESTSRRFSIEPKLNLYYLNLTVY